jgi:predicted DNA-binding protein with PD1-like motif
MHSKMVAHSGGSRTFVLVLAPGEEAFATLTDFAKREKIGGASLTAIGALESATVGWFDWAKKAYRRIDISAQCEVLSGLGDIARDDHDEASVHMHVVLGMRDGSTRGGHLLAGLVRPTLEVMLVETPAHLHRRKRPELGISLIDI